MKRTFEQWIEKLKKKNPNLDWDTMHTSVLAELRDVYEKELKDEEKCSQ